MKILLLADGLEASSLSEPAMWLSEVAARWAVRGHHVQAVCTKPLESWQEPEDPPGVTVLRPPQETFEEVLGEALAMDPDAVHVATSGPLGPRVIEILRDLPVLLDVHDFWPICPNSDLLRRPRLDACGEHYPYSGCGACAGLSRMRAMEEKVALAGAARIVVAHSAFNRVRLNSGLGRPIELLDYGVDTARFTAEPEPPQSPEVAAMVAAGERPRVLFLGSPTPGHGAGLLLDLLVALLARLPEAEFVVAGRDHDNPDWHHMFLTEAREMGLGSHVRVLTAVPPDDMPALVAACRVAIAPAIGHEPGGLFLLQAMAAGLPIVASPLGAIQELVHQGNEGLLVSPRDTSAFATAIWTLLIDPMARIAFGESGRLAAVEHHDFERTLFLLEETYRRLRATPEHRAVA